MKASKQRHVLAAACAALALTLPALAQAEDHGRHEGHGAPFRGWHGDIHSFHEHDLDVWRGGRWYHGNHDGHLGWWWLVAGAWYFYPTPVYPYPDPYQPPVAVVAPEPPGPPHYYYYCTNPVGYYPYVATCTVPWQRVVSPPPQPVAPPMPAEGMPPPPQ